MNILLLASHAVAEHDDLQMFSRMGYNVFAPGGYEDPAHPAEAIRPPVDATHHPDLVKLCQQQRSRGPAGDAIDWAKADIHPDLIDWADAIIVHHFPERWIAPQWPRIRHKRVIWRTCGQSNPNLERLMADYRRDGLGIVRYSPAEQRFFAPLRTWAGSDTVIRFGKDPEEWKGWHGRDKAVGNVTQRLVERGGHCGLSYYIETTRGIPARPAGEQSEMLPGGVGQLDYDAMRAYLRAIRVYLYTGTQPASYTLGLIEAMMTGTPIVSIGPSQMVYPPLFEGHEIAVEYAETPEEAKELLRGYLAAPDTVASEINRDRAIELFGLDAISAQWKAYLA